MLIFLSFTLEIYVEPIFKRGNVSRKEPPRRQSALGGGEGGSDRDSNAQGAVACNVRVLPQLSYGIGTHPLRVARQQAPDAVTAVRTSAPRFTAREDLSRGAGALGNSLVDSRLAEPVTKTNEHGFPGAAQNRALSGL